MERDLVYVIDTHAFIFALTDPSKLGKIGSDIFNKADRKEVKLVLSIVSILEIIAIIEKGVLPINFEKLLKLILSHPSYEIYPLSISILKRISELKSLRDLHDRAIVSTALELNCPLLTRDSKLKKLKILKVIW